MKSEEEWLREHEARISRLEIGLKENVRNAVKNFLSSMKEKGFVLVDLSEVEHHHIDVAEDSQINSLVDEFMDEWEWIT